MSLAAKVPLPSTAAEAGLSSSGRFLVFEGIDGSGKTTIARMMHERMMEIGMPSILTAEPTGGWTGDMAHQGNREATSPFTETLLYVADRAEHSVQIERWLNEGKHVLCDRYVGSTLAYQAVTLHPHMGDRAREWLRAINAPFTLRPDLTLLLSLPPETAMRRLGSRPGREKFEKLGFLRRVDEEYHLLAKMDRWAIVDASRPLEEVADVVWNIIVAM